MPVDALSCQQLWVKRNQIYKFNGYCLKTKKARNYFGNAGCYIHDMSDVPLSKNELNRVLTYKHWGQRLLNSQWPEPSRPRPLRA